jgi:hypothetical protein
VRWWPSRFPFTHDTRTYARTHPLHMVRHCVLDKGLPDEFRMMCYHVNTLGACRPHHSTNALGNSSCW